MRGPDGVEFSAPSPYSKPRPHRPRRAVGLFLHACLAISPEGVPLGFLGGWTGVRPSESNDRHRTPHTAPWEIKQVVGGVT